MAETYIHLFRIPNNCNDASVEISESETGKIVRVIPLACGETQLTLEAGWLVSDTYSYSLTVDGKIIDTKQMKLFR